MEEETTTPTTTTTPVLLKGSCHCGRVAFSVESYTPYPFMICHCNTDTKTAGFYCCNIMAEANTLKLLSPDANTYLKIYQARLDQVESEASKKSGQQLSSHKRHFCSECGSYLWAYDERWSQWIYPFATSIDSPSLPTPTETIHIMCDFKRNHIIPTSTSSGNAKTFPRYPNVGIEQWHRAHGLYGTFQPQQ